MPPTRSRMRNTQICISCEILTGHPRFGLAAAYGPGLRFDVARDPNERVTGALECAFQGVSHSYKPGHKRDGDKRHDERILGQALTVLITYNPRRQFPHGKSPLNT